MSQGSRLQTQFMNKEKMAAPPSHACSALERSIRQRVPPLLTDLYQFTMAYAYWRVGRHNEPAVFELFFRDNPFSGGFSLFSGLHDCLLFLRSFRFTEEGEFCICLLVPGLCLSNNSAFEIIEYFPEVAFKVVYILLAQ